MANADTLGERVELLLKSLHISASTLTRNLERRFNYVGNIVNGCNRKPNDYFFEYLEARYNVNPGWLKNGEGEMFLTGGRQDRFSCASIVKSVSTLNPEDQKSVRSYIEALALREKYIAGKLSEKEDA